MTARSLKRHHSLLTCALLLFLHSVSANDLNTGGQCGLLRTLSTETIGKTGFNIGGGLKYATEMEYITGRNRSDDVVPTGSNSAVDRTTPHLFSGNIFGTYGITSYWDVGIGLPLYYDVPGWNDEDRAGIGDVELSTKVTYPFGRTHAWLSHSYYLKILLPTGSNNRGFFSRHAYYLSSSTITNSNDVFSLSTVYFNPQMIWTVDFSNISSRVPLLLHINFGGVIATTKSNSTLVAAVGLEYRPIPGFTFFTEISGESRVAWYTQVFDITDFINDPFRVSPGMRYTFSNGFYLQLAGDIGVSKSSSRYHTNFSREGYDYATKATPRYGVQITAGYLQRGTRADSDGDGIDDKNDNCIHNAEDIDGFEDTDGCPDIDNDHDGILDASDSCPLEPAASSGCPVLDHDNDGINDDIDKCINDAEDTDGFEDADGCPDLDNDGDGIYDTKDTCPDKAEDSDGFEDTDGCPDVDNDADGVPDSIDQCPSVKGTPENKGCPKTKEIKRGRLILDGVKFESGKAILTPNSDTVLDRVYESLSEWTNVKLEIRGHTDNQGSNTLNMRLSQKRAEAVMRYLTNKGITLDRLRAMGFGESAPIANNQTAAGRAKNRRVELRRID